ncbi:MAG TPA: hypothetical protein VFT91_01335 [Dehalococcoidia bacterium]|nr:hypothetical protein [Dehalococcoidia bacterium]
MAYPGQEPAGHNSRDVTSPRGGTKWTPSRGFWLGMGVVLLFALVLASAGALAASRGPESAPASQPAAPPVQVTVVPPKATPAPDFSGALGEPSSPQAAQPPAGAVSSSTVQAPATVASSWSASPAPAAPAPPSQPAAQSLAQDAAQRYGIRIALDGQDWGPDEASQAANVGAVISAIDRLPVRVTSSVVAHPYGPLTFVSNLQGRTVDGWQPYGGFAMAYYTNSDQGPAGKRPANEVVLITGSADLSIAHEVLHAYQFRDLSPDQYVLALLGDEMRSFMAATGWRQMTSDDEVRAAATQPWESVNGLFAYDGRPLTYVSAAGSQVTLTPANPLEAFAVAGSIYYARPQGMPQPDWPEYWAWLSQNLG